jgi:hypothetical protein
MQDIIYIRDELVLEAHPQGDNPHILLRREGEPGSRSPLSTRGGEWGLPTGTVTSMAA